MGRCRHLRFSTYEYSHLDSELVWSLFLKHLVKDAWREGIFVICNFKAGKLAAQASMKYERISDAQESE